MCIDRLSGPPKLKQDGDSGEEDEVANKVKHIVGFESFTVNNGVRQVRCHDFTEPHSL